MSRQMNPRQGIPETHTLLRPGKVAIVIDGQFGSTGKGLAASFVGTHEFVEIAITNASPNAGHTFVAEDGSRRVAHHLPVSGLMHERSLKYLCAGSIIDPELLLREIEELDIDPSTLFIHPRAAVISRADVAAEQRPDSGAARIASTQKGVGQALARKIKREAVLAGDHPVLRPFARTLDIQAYLDMGLSAVIETPQGLGLGLNSGLSYPHCTSRDITVTQALADAQLHPAYLGRTLMVVRAHPIRVGNLKDEAGCQIGNSGPFYPDSEETSWERLGLAAETTTVTRRIRRVATFSMTQYRDAVRALRPDLVMLNFANYLDPDELGEQLAAMARVKPATHLGFGPSPDDVTLLHSENS